MARKYTKRNRITQGPGGDPGNTGIGGTAQDGGDGSDTIDGHDSFDPGSLGAGSDTVTGAGSDGDNGGTRQRKPRADAGKPRGARKSAPLDLTDLRDILVLAHSAIAMAFSAPKIMIDDGEAEKLGSAIQRVLRHYDLPDVASETKDWLSLLIVAGSIYGPRIASSWADNRTPPPPAPSEQEADNSFIQLVPAATVRTQ